MARLYAGRVGLLGVSNISLKQIDTLIEDVRIVPASVQNRCFANNRWDADVRAFCESHDIIYQGFSLLTANREVLSSPRLADIASRHGKTIPQLRSQATCLLHGAGYIQEYSDTLLKFLLEAKRPATHRVRNINVMSPDGGNAVLEVRWKKPESQQPQETQL
jgi:hypothetical protein